MDVRIEEWLNTKEKNFKAGAELYNKYGSNAALKILFSLPENSTSRAKLITSVAELKANQKQVFTQVEIQKSIEAYHLPKDDWNELPENVQQLLLQARSKFAEAANIHAQLNMLADLGLKEFAPDSEELQQFLKQNNSEALCHTLIDLEDEYIALFEKVNYYRQNKSLPTPISIPDKIKNTPVPELQKQLLNLRTQISKQKKNPKRAAEVEQWIIERNLIQTHLNEFIQRD